MSPLMENHVKSPQNVAGSAGAVCRPPRLTAALFTILTLPRASQVPGGQVMANHQAEEVVEDEAGHVGEGAVVDIIPDVQDTVASNKA